MTEGRATQPVTKALDKADSFNPRALEGRDVPNTHEAHNEPGFNPRAREGRDSYTTISPALNAWFQSTRP